MRRRIGKAKKTGVRKVNVPDLSGLTRSQAKTALEAVGLTWSETSSTMQNINLDNTIESQGVASGTTVKIGDSVSFSYYVYVAPPPPPPPSAPPSSPPSSPPSAPPSAPPSGPPANDCIDDDASFCNNIDANGYGDGYNYQYSPSGLFNCPPRFYGRTFCGVPTPPSAPPADPPAAPPADPPAAPPADPPASPPIDLPPLGPPAAKSVGVSTLIRTPSGLVRAENLNVGDVLLSADLEGFPYNPGEGVTEQALAWTSENPNINFVNTTIVGIRRRIGNKAIVINGDIFSQYHWILVKRDNVIKFVLSENIVENSDHIFDPDTNTWEIVDLFEVIEVAHETISIDCEPYDMFFTEKMLTHDSFSI